MTEHDGVPPLGGVLETGLYVEDLGRARHFYETVLGLEPMYIDERLVAYPAGPGSVLLLFRRGAATEPVILPGGMIPPHDAMGRIHFAFSIAPADLDAWVARLARHGIATEGGVSWPQGGRSVYFRDPDGNLVELATPGLWKNY